MPYIKQEVREIIDNDIEDLWATIKVDTDAKDLDGVLNYVISRIVAEAINPQIPDYYPWSYKNIARAVAVFECAKLEFYRRVAGPKEDRAIEQNGDLACYSAASGS